MRDKPSKTDVIYFITYDEISLISSSAEMICTDIANQTNQTIYAKSMFELCQEAGRLLSFSQIFEYLKEKHPGKNIHVFIDEFDIDDLTLAEVKKVKWLWDEYFKDSLIALFLQTAIKHRQTIKGDKIHDHETNAYEALEMKVFEMKKAMRCSTSITDVIRNVQKQVFLTINNVYTLTEPTLPSRSGNHPLCTTGAPRSTSSTAICRPS